MERGRAAHQRLRSNLMHDTDGQPVIRVTAMPEDANAYSDIFGGRQMSLMDMGAGLVA